MKSHSHSQFFYWLLIHHFRISFCNYSKYECIFLLSLNTNISRLNTLFYTLVPFLKIAIYLRALSYQYTDLHSCFTTVQYSMVWMYQSLFNQLPVNKHWSHPYHAITNNAKHKHIHTSSSFLNEPFMKLLKWFSILDYHKVTRSPG